MIKTASFAPQEPGLEYLTEGGTETEICYRHGHEIREFAMFELIENPAAMTDLCDMYRRYLDVAAKHGFAAMTGGLDYRASPDWGKKLGYSPEGLADIQHRCMGFLREITAPYADQLPKIVLCGYVGPRSDAYDPDMTISVEEAEDYHSVQIQTLKDANADFTWASSFTNVNEAVGVTRAAAKIGMPVAISFTLSGQSRLASGLTLKQAIEEIDRQAGSTKPAFYGINCSHPIEIEAALEPGDWILRMRNMAPNASAQEKSALVDLEGIDDGDPADLGRRMGVLAGRYPHLDIWGGCCGTWDKHFDQIALNVRKARGVFRTL